MKIDVEVHVHLSSVDMKYIKQQLGDLKTITGHIMTKVGDFSNAQTAHNTRMGTALTGISEDIAALNAKIAELQGTQGAITAEDQALLDELQAQGEALAGRIEAADALTPPVVPVTP